MPTLAERNANMPPRPGPRHPGYGFPNTPSPAPAAPPAGQYPGALPTYGKPPSYASQIGNYGTPPSYAGQGRTYRPKTNFGSVPTYGPNTNFGPAQTYAFAPYVDTVAQTQSNQMMTMMKAQLATEQQQRAAEIRQMRSQWHAPRQSRMTLLEGY